MGSRALSSGGRQLESVGICCRKDGAFIRVRFVQKDFEGIVLNFSYLCLDLFEKGKV